MILEPFLEKTIGYSTSVMCDSHNYLMLDLDYTCIKLLIHVLNY